MDYKELGNRVKKRRKGLQLTQQQLAEILGISPAYMGFIESGNKKPSFETLIKIATHLHMSLDYLAFGDLAITEKQSLSELEELLSNCSSQEIKQIIEVIKAILPRLKIE